HPVVWRGTMAQGLERLSGGADPTAPRRQYAWGAMGLMGIGLGAAGLGWGVEQWAEIGSGAEAGSGVQGGNGWPQWPYWAAMGAGAWSLKGSFALQGLGKAALAVSRPLEDSTGEPHPAGQQLEDNRLEETRLAEARLALKSLCSRDASRLDPGQLSAAAVESLAENFCDSVAAPLFYYVLFGLPGVLFYRAVNTLDAMWGYRGRYEYLGKPAARLDDALNFVPARLAALLLVGAGAILGFPWRAGLQAWKQDGRRTPSPNGGRPMAAMAGLLGIRLEKPGVYRLWPQGQDPTPQDIPRGWQVVRLAAWMALGAAGLALFWGRGWPG
ncbi:MAG: adenosylcobinamide-phosphate synthase CbiB, partial [Deltaproteobacteria bacterium]|nr:adenosylcobinamide-phosphate synthase CbiB [Deltaproteobacteria bacterium]